MVWKNSIISITYKDKIQQRPATLALKLPASLTLTAEKAPGLADRPKSGVLKKVGLQLCRRALKYVQVTTYIAPTAIAETTGVAD